MTEWSTTRSTGTSGSTLGVLALFDGHVAHGCQVGQERHAGEVLEHHAGHDERDFVDAFAAGRPVGELLDVGRRDLAAVAVAQHRLQDDAKGHRQLVDVGVSLGQFGQREELAGGARGGLEGLQGTGESVGSSLLLGGHQNSPGGVR